MSDVMHSAVDSKRGSIGKAGSIVTTLVAAGFAVQSLLNPTPVIAGGDNNIDGTSFSESFGEKYEKCGNYTKNKCAEIAPEFTFLGDQEIDMVFFDKNEISGNTGNINLTDNGYPVMIIDGAMAEKATFSKNTNKIYKDDDGKLVIENNSGDKKYYTIKKVKNGMTNLKEYYKVKMEIDGVEVDLDSIKKLDLSGKVGKTIELDNSNGEVYELSYKGKKIEGILNYNTKNIYLSEKGILHIKDKGDLLGKIYKIIDKGDYYTLEEKEIKISYKK